MPNANTGEAATKNNNFAKVSFSEDCNGLYPNPLRSINWRASPVPAAAVIPAPIAYINVVAVKKLVVGFRDLWLCRAPARPGSARTAVGSTRHIRP